MADPKSKQRVARLRQSRRSRGETETNVWLPAAVRTAIDNVVSAGRYPSRRVAITEALEKEFLGKEKGPSER